MKKLRSISSVFFEHRRPYVYALSKRLLRNFTLLNQYRNVGESLQ